MKLILRTKCPFQECRLFRGSTLFLSQGDIVDLESLLIGITVGSGNDAAVAVAEYMAGSEEALWSA